MVLREGPDMVHSMGSVEIWICVFNIVQGGKYDAGKTTQPHEVALAVNAIVCSPAPTSQFMLFFYSRTTLWWVPLFFIFHFSFSFGSFL